MQASYNGHVEAVKFLVEAGAEVNAKTTDGATALLWASIQGHVEAVKFLVEAGAKVNNTENFAARTALYFAEENAKQNPAKYAKYEPIAAYLRSKGATRC
mmetsp:Transcript_144974/g.464630  ORF Transcript_144974/g.464630 Transcript_144974/m.464630 type:complete len:100 (+) Transcript_144974:231-530(+)